MLAYIVGLVVVSLSAVTVTGIAPPVPPPFQGKCLAGLESTYPPPKDASLKWYTVDLDKPSEDRWTEIVTDYKDQINELVGVIKNLTYAFFEGKAIQWVDAHMGNWDDKFRSPYREELKGISKAIGIPLGQDERGQLFHARNMDFGVFMGWDPKKHDWDIAERIRNLEIQVNFKRNGKTLFQSVTFPGFLGVFSAMKKDRFTLSLNERYTLKGGYLGLFKWLVRGSSESFTTYLARDVMENVDSYDEAKSMLMHTNITSPIYYLLGGNQTNQGSLIVRGLTDMPDKIELNAAPHKWFILQTNYDPSKEPFFLDDRRNPGNVCMNQLGQFRLDFSGLYTVLSSKPNFNLLTVLTHLMKVDTGMETYRRKCPQPCWFT